MSLETVGLDCTEQYSPAIRALMAARDKVRAHLEIARIEFINVTRSHMSNISYYERQESDLSYAIAALSPNLSGEASCGSAIPNQAQNRKPLSR
jgi:hypothetical protein